jgi:ribosomal protein S18 acetylase RimI-like enzyme
VRIVHLGADEVLGPGRADVEALWRRVWPATTRERVDEILPRHAAREGFRFVAAVDEGSLVGMAYGYLGGPGEWWHDRVAGAMTDEQRARWLAPGHLELVELMVDPAQRRRGLGRALHDELLLDHRSTVVLSTQTDNEEALALYRSLGYEVVVPEIDLGGGDRMYCILGGDVTPEH